MTEQKVEVVISGIGGLFPECDHLDELKQMLFAKKNGVTSDTRRWTPGILGTPYGVGKIKTPEKFDNIFFGIHRKMAESLDALTRLSLERSVEAIVDAGLNPSDLSGTNTAVFMSSCISDSEFFEVFDTHQKGFGLLGHNRAMQANRLSYTLNLNGPSYSTDSTWIGGAQCFMRAKKMIEDGEINAAIIGSCSLCFNPNISLQLEGLGRLTNANETRSFSDDANGMNRSEACVVVLLQKLSEAKRSYATLLGATGIYGETDDLFYHYSDHLYKEVLLNAYKEANIDPAKVGYIEGEGLGIKKIDAMELNIMGEVFCTPNRIEPLKVGSIKSNVGHCEAASSLVSIAKALIILDSGYIPPNINYSEPNQDCPALLSGKIEVVTEKTPLKGDIVGISSFGLCNSFSHVILKQNKKSRTKIYEKGEMFEDGLPRIIFVSGRNEEGVIQLLERIKNSQMDEEFAALLQSVFYKSMNAHYYRSFTIVPDKNDGSPEDISYIPAIIKRPIWFVFSGMGSQWNGMGKQLLNIPIFAESVRKCDAVLKPKGVDLIDILTNEDPTLFDNILNSFVGIAATQIGLLDVLKSIDIVPDGIIGHSVGELGCAYADGCFTAEQMILAAHARGLASIETELIDGSMAAIGLGYNDIKDRLPHDIEVACHNASDSSTLSGPTASVSNFVEQLKSEGVFAKLVNVSNIAYHSQYIKPAAPTLLKYLKKVIPEPKPRSSKWVSSSVPESEWGNEVAKYSSAEYHTNNLLGQVLFEEASRHIPEDAIVIEIAPHGLLQAILKRSLSKKVTNIPLTHRSTKDSVRFLISAFGKMYNNGMTPNIEAFYPPINYPVSRQTQTLHSIFPWDHKEEWLLKSMMQTTTRVSGERKFTIHLNNKHILFDYKINGRHILPSSILLFHAWESFIIIQNELYFDEMIVFEELNFRRNIEIAENDTLEFYSLIQCGSGYFEICLDDEVIVSGKILRSDVIDMTPIKPKMKYPETVFNLPHSSISKHDLYSLLEHNGYELGEQFKTVTNIDLHFEEYRGNIKWDNDWMKFINGIFTFLIYKSMETNDNPADVSTIRKMYIDPSKFKDSVGKDVSIYYNFNTNEINGDGIYILHPEIKSFSISTLNPFELRLEVEQFVQLANPNCENEVNFINNCLQVIFEHKKFQSNPNMNNFKVYYSCNDNNLNQSITLVKQILDIQIGIQHTVVSLDETNPEMFTNNDHNIILLPNDQMTNVISVLKNTKKVHLLVTSKEPMSSTKEWNVIMQQQFNGHYLVLIKKIKEIKIISTQLESITDLQNFYRTVKNSLAKHKKTKSYVYIFTKIVPYVNLTRFIEEVLLKNKSNKIRFVFLLDNSGPDFNIDHTFYAEQLRKQLFVNIYKDGKWGTIVRNLVDNSSFNVYTNNTITTYISDLTLHGLDVKYLGINFQDLYVNNNIIDNDLGHLEYSGITDDGKKVMGIAPLIKNTSNQIYPDPHLTWIIPSEQTLEDAATIPMSYSMAYYILAILKPPTDNIYEKTILINAGFNAVGQAAIAVAIWLGYSVYITVENKEQCTLLKNKFPSLPECRIFNYHDNFEVQLKIATKGKGVAIIINCLNGRNFYAAIRALAAHGQFFQLTKDIMKNKDKLGMLIFLKNITFYGVSPDSLLAETSEIKLKVQNEVQKGMDLGIVKPFDKNVLTGPCSREQAIQSLYLSSQGVESNRVVLALEGKKTLGKFLKGSDFEKYQCDSNRVYLIVGSKYSTWIDIAEWIVMRGARKIVVALKKYSMSTIASRRFNLLISRYQNVMIQIVSDSNLNSKEDLIMLLNDTTSIYPLGGIFFATLTDEEDNLRNIQYVLESDPSLRNLKPIFVCIMSGGENTCSELRANGVCPNTICLTWSLVAEEPNFSNLVPSLDKLLLNIDQLSSSTIICTEYNKKLIASREFYSKIIEELPASIDELNAFGDTVTEEIGFIEVPTKSPRFADSIGLPVFVVTGFIPKRMKTIYDNLIYPAFEARLPETIESIEHVARILVQKLKSITKCGNVSLIGVSWGGAVCVLIAQLLEADNIAVGLTLLEGIPNVLQEWTKSLLQYGNINAKLLLNYFEISSTMAREIATKNGWNTKLSKVLSLNEVLTTDKTLKALNAIRSRLSALFELRPLPNRIIAKVNVVYRTINFEKSKPYKLEEYCVYLPEIIVFDEKDYEKMVSEKELFQFINNNILHYHPDANKIPLPELYNRAGLNAVGLTII